MKINGIEIVGEDPPKTIKDIRGEKFNRFTCFGYSHKKLYKGGTYHYFWMFRCSCGTEKIKRGGTIVNGDIKSCGCKNLESLKARKTHGGSTTREYFIWCEMRYRCENKNKNEYKDYGGRGIEVCERWKGKNGFSNFLKDMGKCPEGKSLDRRDNSKGYNPSNCKWSTSKEQNRNRRDNFMLTYRGETKCLSEWAEELGFNVGTLYSRIAESGWSVERALSTPLSRFSGD